MDLKGSIVNCNIRIYPSEELKKYVKCITITDKTPPNILKLARDDKNLNKEQVGPVERNKISYTSDDIKHLNKIKALVGDGSNSNTDTSSYKSENLCEEDEIKQNLDNSEDNKDELKEEKSKEDDSIKDKLKKEVFKEDDVKKEESKENDIKEDNTKEDHLKEEKSEEDYLKGKIYLNTDDIDWLYVYIANKRENSGKEVPYLHELFEGSHIVLPENEIIKRNPVLEARCVKLRAQQEAREYRKMTKGVDNVRMRFPEDSISYQMKQLNRQLIAIGQFILSIFAGFLFGFRGVEWMVGNLDFGFRLLLGVMCALVIALAEIYFLAKKLNEELNVPETVQLGGPPKFVNEPYFGYKNNEVVKKEHQD